MEGTRPPPPPPKNLGNPLVTMCSAAGAAESRIRHFSCDHVVPAANLLPLVLAAGPSGAQLDFSYQNRATPATLGTMTCISMYTVLVNEAGELRGGGVQHTGYFK